MNKGDHVPQPIVMPDLKSVARRSIPNLIVGKAIPVLLFVALLEVRNSTWALAAALTWSVSAIAIQHARRRRVPGLVLLSAVMLTAKTIAAIISGNLMVYFIPPTITTGLVGLAFLISVPLGAPLAGRLAEDFCPFDDDTRCHPVLHQFFIRLSLIWAVTSLVDAGITLWLLMTQSTTTFVIAKSFLGPATTAVTLAIGVALFRAMTLSSGTQVQFSKSEREPVTTRR